MNAIYEKYKDQGLVVVGVSNEPVKLLDAYVEKMNVAFPVISAPKGMTAYGVSAYPTHVLISASGRVISTGRPDEGLIETALKSVIQFPVIAGKGGKLDGLRKACAKSDILGVAKALARAEQDSKMPAQDMETVKTIRAKFKSVVDMTSSEIESMDGPDYFADVERLQELEKNFKGLPLEADAKTKVAEFKKDPKIKREITAMKLLQSIRDRYDLRKSSSRKKIVKALAGLIRKYPDSLAAEKARAMRVGRQRH